MWDPDQLAEIPVLADRLQTSGDPLGEWLAIRIRLETSDVPRAGRQLLRRRARTLREQLGARLILADDPDLGRPHAIRELGLLADISFESATPGRLATLLARPDAPFVLRLHLRGDASALLACVELLLGERDRSGRAGALQRRGLRQLLLEPIDELGDPHPTAGASLHAQLTADADSIGERLPSLFSLEVDRRAVALPHDPAQLDAPAPWSPARRAALGRALASPAPAARRLALVRLREHGSDAGQLRGPLLAIIEHDPEPEVRAAALAIVPVLGGLAPVFMALLGDAVRERDDPQLRGWIEAARKVGPEV